MGVGQDVAVGADDKARSQRLCLEFARSRPLVGVVGHETAEKFVERVVFVQLRQLARQRVAARRLRGADVDHRRTLLLDQFREVRQLSEGLQWHKKTQRQNEVPDHVQPFLKMFFH